MVNISFRGKTNFNDVMINTLTFVLKDEKRITIDRERTEYSIKDGNLEMKWVNCYFWDEAHQDVNRCYLTEDDLSMLNPEEVERIEVEIEDEAGLEYEVSIDSFEV